MRNIFGWYITALALAIVLVACNEATPPKELRSAQSLIRQAFDTLATDPPSAVGLFLDAAEIHEMNDSLPQAAIALLNAANIEDEFLENYETARMHAKRSLAHWETLDNQMEVANLLKYCGFLSGMLGEFVQAKIQISEAKLIYVELGYEPGQVVCDFNLAKVYLEQGLFDESLLSLVNAQAYWIKIGDSARLEIAARFELQLYKAAGWKHNDVSLED
jgi:tetratricopeptide (TPR) repeat protein